MTPKTLTTISALRPGDRFYFSTDKSKTVWELIRLIGKKDAEINQKINGNYLFKHHRIVYPYKEVVFLRHTAESINETDDLTGII